MPDTSLPQVHRLSAAAIGEPLEIPAGTPVHSTRYGQWTVSKRKQTIRPWSTLKTDDGRVAEVTWAGAGGYWRRVRTIDGEFVGHFGFPETAR